MTTDSALETVYPFSLQQRCWNHKLRNVLDVVALKHQPAVRACLQQIAAAESKVQAEHMRPEFRKSYECVHPKAVERLERDWERMISYYAFPKEHWKHIRTTNIIESLFSAVRLRTGAAKRFRRVESNIGFRGASICPTPGLEEIAAGRRTRVLPWPRGFANAANLEGLLLLDQEGRHGDTCSALIGLRAGNLHDSTSEWQAIANRMS